MKHLKYKETGIEWLGDIPEHWTVKKLRFLVKITTGDKDTENREEDGEYPFYVRSQTVESISSYSFDGEAILTAGDGVGVCKVWHYVNGKFDFHQRVYMLYGFKELLGKYLFHYIRSNFIHEILKLSAKSTVDSLRLPMFKEFIVAYPEIEEQEAISNFLDEKVSMLESLIANKHSFIEKLHEKRICIISNAVTKGLNPLVKMKDSKNEFLGNIPANWSIIRLKYLTSESLKYGANVPAELDDQNLPRYVRITDVDSEGNLRDETFRSIEKEVALPYLLKEGDILFARSGATVGKTFIYRKDWGECAYAGYLIKARINKKVYDPMFIYYYTKSDGYLQWIQSVTIQATIQNVSAEKYSSLWFAIPPSLSEQKNIVEYLNQESNKIDTLISKTEQAIERLEEYKTALISSVVTGKIKVQK